MSKKKRHNGQGPETNVIHVFVDESNLKHGQKTKGRFLDYKKVADYVQQRYKASAVQVFLYLAYPPGETRSYDVSKKHNYYGLLKTKLGFKVRKKKLQRLTVVTKDGLEILEKGNMDVELVIDAMHTMKEFNAAVILSGDSDFLPLVTYLQRQGKKVYLFSFKSSIAEELKKGADEYKDINGISEDIWGSEMRS